MNPSAELPRDEVLVADYLQGENRAFSQLYQRYKNRMFLLVRNYFPNRSLAEEVFQEVFMKVIEKLGSFDGNGSFKGWIYTLARHHCIDRLRYAARRPEVPDSQFKRDAEDPPTPLERSVAEQTSAEERSYDRELAQGLNAALAKLPDEQRETFLLRERGGLTFEEIAQSQHVSVNTVKSRMRYAIESLRRVLRGKDFVKEALE